MERLRVDQEAKFAPLGFQAISYSETSAVAQVLYHQWKHWWSVVHGCDGIDKQQACYTKRAK